MNRWAANNPELYEEIGHDGMADHFASMADEARDRAKDEQIEKALANEAAKAANQDTQRGPK